MRRDAERIKDILEACALVAEYLAMRTWRHFISDNLFRDAVVRQLTIVGEAATKLSPQFKAAHPEIPWQEIAGFRNRIVHDYFGLNLDTTWQVASRNLPELHVQLSLILADEFGDESA